MAKRGRLRKPNSLQQKITAIFVIDIATCIVTVVNILVIVVVVVNVVVKIPLDHGK